MAPEAFAFGCAIGRAFRESAHDADGSAISLVFADESSVASDGLHTHSLQGADLRRVPPRLRQWSYDLRARLFDGASDELSFRCLSRLNPGSEQRDDSLCRVRSPTLRRRLSETSYFEQGRVGF